MTNDLEVVGHERVATGSVLTSASYHAENDEQCRYDDGEDQKDNSGNQPCVCCARIVARKQSSCSRHQQVNGDVRERYRRHGADD